MTREQEIRERLEKIMEKWDGVNETPRHLNDIAYLLGEVKRLRDLVGLAYREGAEDNSWEYTGKPPVGAVVLAGWLASDAKKEILNDD